MTIIIPDDVPRSNVNARTTLIAGGRLDRVINSLAGLELDQWKSVGLIEDLNTASVFLSGQTPLDPPPFDWDKKISDSTQMIRRKGIWLLWKEPPQINSPQINPPPKCDPQLEVIKAIASACQLVDAPPGTGKTFCLLKRLKYLTESGLTSNLRADALVLTFSRTAKAEAKARAAKEFSDGDLTQQPEFRTIDSLAVELLDLAKGESIGDHDTRKKRLLSVLANGGEPYAKVRTRLARYKWIFIDEFQDIIGLNGRTLLEIIKLAIEGRRCLGSTEEGKRPPGLLVLGDHRQYINFFQMKEITDPKDREIDPEQFNRRLENLLRENHTAFDRIAMTKIYRANSRDFENLMGNVRGILDIALQTDSDLNDCWKKLVEQIRPTWRDPCDKDGLIRLLNNNDVSGESVSGRFGILTRGNARARMLASVCMADSRLRSRVNLVQSPEGLGFPGWLGMIVDQAQGGNLADENVLNQAYGNVPGNRKPSPQDAKEYIQEVASALGLIRQGQIPANSLRDSMDGGDEPSELRLVSDPGGIWISTVHQSKGRQFPEVFLDKPGLLEEHLPGRARDEQLESIRITYVAATRAMRKIYPLSNDLVFGLVDWQPDRDQLPNGGGLDDINYWKDWYHSLGSSWDTAIDFLWDAYRDDRSLRIWNRDGVWRLAVGHDSIEINPYYNQMLSLKSGKQGALAEFHCQILDLRSRVSGGKLFLMPVLSGNLQR